MDFLQAPENEKLARQFLDRAYREEKPTDDIAPGTAVSILSAIFNADRKNVVEMPVSNGRGSAYSRTAWTRYAAAAVILLVLSTAAYFFLRSPGGGSPEPLTQNSTVQPDIAPGGEKAVLVLDDGSTIMLDSVHNGELVRQGNTNITKLADGRIVYHPGETKQETVMFNTMRTPKGGKYRLMLSDGTGVWLNAASSIRYPTVFTGPERKVEITGEAYFEVARNAAAPFRVIANGIEVKVLGTHFNINAYEDESSVSTTLVEGSVSISADGVAASTLTPGQQAQFDRSKEEMKLIEQADIEQVLAWKNGFFRFNGTNIRSIMREVSRWYDVDVVYEVPTDSLNFSGLVSAKENVSHLLKIMELAGLHFKIEGKKITVTHDPKD